MNDELLDELFDEPFEVMLKDDNPNREYTSVYNGLLDSPLFDMSEVLLLISIMILAKAEIDSINTATASINTLCRFTSSNKQTVHKKIKQLEEKGVLIKQNNERMPNTYKVLNYISVWDCGTLEELKKETDRIKKNSCILPTNNLFNFRGLSKSFILFGGLICLKLWIGSKSAKQGNNWLSNQMMSYKKTAIP